MPRIEDPPLLQGKACFTDDIRIESPLVMTVFRAPIAHGRIVSLDTSTAAAMPGVAAVLTAADLASHNIKPLNCRAEITDISGAPMLEPDRPVLTDDRIVHIGQPIAAVIATTLEQAHDALETIALETTNLPAVTSPDGAGAPDAPIIWEDIPGNRAFSWQMGNAKLLAQQFASAAHTIERRVDHPRIAISPVEPRACVAQFDTTNGAFTLTTPSQGVISLQRALSGFMGIEPEQLRVMTHDTGGSFAVKIWPYPEQILALLAAKVTAQAVKWNATRNESFLADAMGRGRTDYARLAVDEDGKFLAFAIDARADMGAFLNAVGPYVATTGAVRPFGQTYNIPALHYQVQAMYTNAIPTDAYRGAGKPESCATLERLIDCAAQQLGMDPFELRRQNLITPADLPFQTPMSETYDAGDFPALADALNSAADWSGLAARKTGSQSRGLVRGAGVAFYLHATGGSTQERSEVHALEDGNILVRTGLQDNGQGHKTVLATVTAEALDIDIERVRVEQGDTEWLKTGGGTGGSNLVPVAANTVHRAALQLIEHGKQIAAELLETASVDVDYNGGEFCVVGTDKRLSLAAVAQGFSNADSVQKQAMPETGCVGQLDFEGIHTTFPNGGSVCEIELDPDTGHVRIDRYISIDDVGRVFDQPSTMGQLHGGIAQALGEVMLENVHYDKYGQLQSGSLMDYALPRAGDLPQLQTSLQATDSPNSLLGAKGVGELTAIGAPGPILNAIHDALASLGVEHLDMPLTPLKVWNAIHQAKSMDV